MPGKRVEALDWQPAEEIAVERTFALDLATLIGLALASTREEVERLVLPAGYLPPSFTLGGLQATSEELQGPGTGQGELSAQVGRPRAGRADRGCLASRCEPSGAALPASAMNGARTIPLGAAVRHMRAGILRSRMHDAFDAYAQAGLLLGHPGETQRLWQAHVCLLHTRLLVLPYEVLLGRHGKRIVEGRQLVLPWERRQRLLQRQLCGIAIDFVPGTGRAQAQR